MRYARLRCAEAVFVVMNSSCAISRLVLPAAVIMGLLSETLKYAYVLALPRLNFQEAVIWRSIVRFACCA